MKILNTLAGTAVVSAAIFASPASAACQAPIALNMSGPRPTLTFALANGHSGTAMFDTGSMGSGFVDPGAIEALGLADEGPAGPPFDRMPGADIHRTTLKGLRLGGVRVGDLSLPMLPTMLPGFSAVLGPKAFAGRLLELDFGSGKMRVCDRAAGLRALGKGTPFTAGPVPLPGIPVRFGNTTVEGHIDSGSPFGLSFPMRFADQFTLDAPLVQKGKARGHDGEHPIFVGRIKGVVKVGPLTLTDPEVHFSDVNPVPNIGSALLRQLVVTIDPSGQQTWTRLGATMPH